jgi:Domain of unknown function, B. Theta Gene description (DUF3873)
MKTDVRGCSQCRPGEEQSEMFTTPAGNERIQYDYRDWDGVLFSCIARDLFDARLQRDKWLRMKEKEEIK